MKSVEVAIIGAGVSGLYAASLLQQSGVSYVVLEGRDVSGGRLISCHTPENTLAPPSCQIDKYSRIDLGATWVWPSIQTQLAALMNELGIQLIPQNEQGEMLFERSHHVPASRYPGYASSPSSMRSAQGMRVLTERLQERLPFEAVVTGHRVTHVAMEDSGIHVQAESRSGNLLEISAQHIFLALPPALAATIDFNPPLPEVLRNEWANTGTWMAPHAKYVAVYNTAFWLKEGLSGEARSGVGPMVEIHDASVPDGVNALFGFIGIPAKSRWTTSEDNLKALCRAQMVRLFGPAAANPVAEYFKDWAADPYTATEFDLSTQAGHFVPPSSPTEGVWQTRLHGIASEWSPMFPGYLAGAVDAASEGVRLYRL
ncbi:FAD-dependent oxidoreductase [Citrobacter koseri]